MWGIHPSEAFRLLELSLGVCTGLSHKGSVNHPLIFCSFRVEQGVCPECFTQSFIKISWGGGLIAFWIIVVILDILVGFLAPTQSPCRRASRYQPRVSCPSLVLKSQLGLVSGIASHAHPSASKTSGRLSSEPFLGFCWDTSPFFSSEERRKELATVFPCRLMGVENGL